MYTLKATYSNGAVYKEYGLLKQHVNAAKERVYVNAKDERIEITSVRVTKQHH